MPPQVDSLHQTERTALALGAINDGIWDWDVESNEIYFSPRWKKMLDYSDAEVSNNFHGWQMLIHPDDLGTWLNTWVDFMESSRSQFVIEYRLRARNGSWRWVQCHGVGERSGNGVPKRIAGCHTDITQIKEYEQQLQDQQRELENMVRLRTLELEHANTELHRIASHDYLTGVWNRRSFEENLRREWARARRLMSTLSLIMVDIDHFKAVNDHFGHLAGDACLAQVAEALRIQLNRPTDDIYRYGGEEFAILLPDTGLSGAMDVAERMRSRVEQLTPPSGITGRITVSLGVATGAPTPSSANWHSLIAVSDSALYHAKRNGRNRVTSRQWPDDASSQFKDIN